MKNAGKKEIQAGKGSEGMGFGFERLWEGVIGLEMYTIDCYMLWQSKTLLRNIKLL
jgi:hypothetical protein